MLQISRRREFLIPQPYQGVVVKRHSVGEAFVADAAGPDALQKLARYERTLMNNQQPCVSSRSCGMAAWSRPPTRSDVQVELRLQSQRLCRRTSPSPSSSEIPGHHRQAHRSMKRGGLRRDTRENETLTCPVCTKQVNLVKYFRLVVRNISRTYRDGTQRR